jgi:hypothetical protein
MYVKWVAPWEVARLHHSTPIGVPVVGEWCEQEGITTKQTSPTIRCGHAVKKPKFLKFVLSGTWVGLESTPYFSLLTCSSILR